MKKLLPLMLLTAVLFTACQPSPKPIEYGSDMCDFCKMTIVDQQHGTEVVTSKGKVFKFDAVECMSNFIEQEGETNYAFLLVNDFDAPKDLVDAKSSFYLISKNMPSPMGANLTAFSSKAAAEKMQASKGGQVYNWTDLQVFLKQSGIVKTAEALR